MTQVFDLNQIKSYDCATNSLIYDAKIDYDEPYWIDQIESMKKLEQERARKKLHEKYEKQRLVRMARMDKRDKICKCGCEVQNLERHLQTRKHAERMDLIDRVKKETIEKERTT